VIDHKKHQLICEGVERLHGPRSPIPSGRHLALWIDFACINQDSSPAAELEERMAALIGCCDMLLTPIVDEDHKSWSLPLTFQNAIDDYKAVAWQEYWKRAWCRVEAYLAAAVPVEASKVRAKSYRGGLRAGLEAGRRPHCIFGTKELEKGGPPVFLPPMVNATYEKYLPAKGQLTSEADRPVVRALTTRTTKASRTATAA